MKREFYFQRTLNNECCAITLAAVRTAAFVWSLIGKKRFGINGSVVLRRQMPLLTTVRLPQSTFPGVAVTQLRVQIALPVHF